MPTVPSDSAIQDKARAYVRKNFSAPQIVSDAFSVSGGEDFAIVGDVEATVVKRDEHGGIWVEVRVKCEGAVTFDEDEDPLTYPRHYFLTGKIVIYEDIDDIQWHGGFPNEIRYEDLQGEGSYMKPFPDDQ